MAVPDSPEQPNARATRLTAKQRAFLAAFAELGTVSQAAERAEVGRTCHYDWLARSDAYADAFASVAEQFADRVEAEARRRAIEGWDEPVWHQGQMCGLVRKFSDRLLELLLKAKRPGQYRERFEHTGANGAPLSVHLVRFSDGDGA